MKAQDLTDKLRAQYVGDVVGEKKNRTLEDALQEALNNTTPAFPGTPDHAKEEHGEKDDAQWI